MRNIECEERVMLTFEQYQTLIGVYMMKDPYFEYSEIENIYLDDERTPIWKNVPADTSIIICRSYKEAVDAVNLFSNKGWTNLFIDLDHDLGTKKTGYDFCKWFLPFSVTGCPEKMTCCGSLFS